MNIFISGGCKNGKSMYAQKMARDMAEDNGTPLYYIATMIPVDEEDRARVRRHIAERDGWGFETLEQGRNILNALKEADSKGAFLLDSVTALLANEMFKPDGKCDFTAGKRLAAELEEFAKATGNTVFVSDYLYADGRFFDQYTEGYRRNLALIDRRLAEVCDMVIEVAYGHIYVHKRGQ